VLTIIVNEFDKKSEIELFDTNKNLSLMENLLPIAVAETIVLVHSQELSEPVEKVLVSLL
jgi:hypothetical protein